jgi:hypothetical protein
MRLIPNLEKSAIKLENRQESALILEKELFKKIHLNTASTRIAFYVSIWLKEDVQRTSIRLRSCMVLTKQSLSRFLTPFDSCNLVRKILCTYK